MGAAKKDSVPDSADTELGSTVHDTAPSSLPDDGEAMANDSYAFLPSDLPNRDAVADVLRGLKDAQEDPWAPTPEFVASSAGAEFAAYQGRHAPAVRHATPVPAGAAVILNVTEPLPSPGPSVGVPPPDLVTTLPLASRAAPADVTQLDLTTLIERAKAREEAAAAEEGARNERERETVLKRGRGAFSPGSARALQLSLLGLGVLLVLGLVYAFAVSGHPANPPTGASEIGSSRLPPATPPPSLSASAAPLAPASPALSSAPPTVTAAPRPEPPVNLAPPAPIPTVRPRPHGLTAAPSAVPTTAEPKRDAAPKNDFVW